MENYYLPEINHIGLKHVETWLSENGYFDIHKELLQINDYGFIAKGKIEGILVQVRTFRHPQGHFKLSDFEIKALTIKAIKYKAVAYAAYAIIDDDNNLVNEIIWDRLS
jgi:hypothetical protein